jgi:hypothetical protein
MSAILETALTAEQVRECEKNDEALAADLAEDIDKSARRHAVNDRRAMDLQLQVQHFRVMGLL